MWHAVLQEVDKLNVPENKVLRRIFVTKKSLHIA
jgi:hypothetical protein